MPYVLKKDVVEDFSKLGYKNIDIPKDADISDLQEQKPDPDPNPQVNDDVAQVQLESQNVDQVNLSEEKPSPESSTQQQSGEDVAGVSEQEQQRRTWQSEADRAKAILQEEKKKNEYLMQMLANVAGVNTGGGNAAQASSQGSAPVQQTSLSDKEPQLFDFISEDEYDPEDVLDMRTKTGRAYSKYQTALREYDRNVIKQDILRETQKQTQQESAVRQAKYLADKYPEFKNPFTGEPDMNKIINFIQNLSSSDEESLWADLYSFQQAKKNNTSNINAGTIDKIGQRANNVSSVTSRVPAEKEKLSVPKEIKSLVDIYGKIEIPDNAAF